MNSGEELFNLIRDRRSVRRFKPERVPRECLSRLIEAATWAPSSSNRQDWFFSVITSPSLKKQMAQAVRARWKAIVEENRSQGFIEDVARYSTGFANFEHAPAVIVVSASKVNEFQKLVLGDSAHAVSGSATSAAMAAQNLMLAASALGLGTCCMTGALAARNQLASLIGLGKRQEIVCLIAVGYPDESPLAPERKPITEVSKFLV
jgi:nitroreductase